MSSELHIDLATAQRLVAEAVEEKGADYTYPNPPLTQDGDRNVSSCFYVHTPELYPEDDPNRPSESVPGCIVGNALHRAGVALEVLAAGDKDDEDGSLLAGCLLERLKRDGLITYTDDASRFLRSAQSAQDIGSTWGDAVQRATA